MPDYPRPELTAEQRLMAAAPELLAVCEELVESAEYWGEYDVPCGIVDRLNAAIAKAGGTAMRAPDRCQWTEDEAWSTSCGQLFEITHGTPGVNKMTFCSFCGRPIDHQDSPGQRPDTPYAPD